MLRAAKIAIIIALPVIILLTSLQVIVFQERYFDMQFTRYNIEEATTIEHDDLLNIMGEVMKYLEGDREDLVVFSTVGGEEREVFGQRAKDHMIDVQELFLKGFFIRNSLLILLSLSLLFIFFKSNGSKKIIAQTFAWASWLPLSITVLSVIIVSTNFSYFFTMFHEIFFDNDLWILDPSQEVLIQMLPEGFFMDTAFISATMFMITLALIGTVSLVFLKKASLKN